MRHLEQTLGNTSLDHEGWPRMRSHMLPQRLDSALDVSWWQCTRNGHTSYHSTRSFDGARLALSEHIECCPSFDLYRLNIHTTHPCHASRLLVVGTNIPTRLHNSREVIFVGIIVVPSCTVRGTKHPKLVFVFRWYHVLLKGFVLQSVTHRYRLSWISLQPSLYNSTPPTK